MCVGILITSVGNEVEILLSLRHVWSKNFPIIATILELDFAFQGFYKVLTNFGGASEERHPGVSLLEDLLHDWAISMDKV